VSYVLKSSQLFATEKMTRVNCLSKIKDQVVRSIHVQKKKSRMTTQFFEAFFVIDFEATCLKNETIEPQVFSF